MVASWCDECLTMLCGLILGYVLQVQVAAWLVLVQVNNKRERSLLVRPPGVEKTRGLVWGTRWPVGSSTGCMVSRTTRWSRVRFLAWAQNQGRAGTLWEPSHELWLAVATSSSWGLRWFTKKPSGYSAEPQSRGWWPGVVVRPKPPSPVWRTGLTGLGSEGARCFEAEGSLGLRQGYAKCGHQASVRWCYKDKFPKCPWWACILV
jgi:hypothetical protein